MDQLIQSSDLFVMQVEMDIYTALKKVADIIYHHSILWYYGHNLKDFVYDLLCWLPING